MGSYCSSMSVKEALTGQFSLPDQGSLVTADGHGVMPCNFHDHLLIYVVLIELGGGRGAKGMVGVMAWKASKPTHVTHCSAFNFLISVTSLHKANLRLSTVIVALSSMSHWINSRPEAFLKACHSL